MKLFRVLLGLAMIAVVTIMSDFERSPETETATDDGSPEQVVTSTREILNVATSTIQTNAFVVRAVDGDTLVVTIDGQPKEVTIRLLGINTPETVDPRRKVECFGKEASARMHELVDGKRVRLVEDVQADNVDKYGRLLRNVLSDGGVDVNAVMVGEGYAYSYLSFPLNPSRKAELKKLENDARIAQRGLWSTSTCSGLK